MMKWLSLAIVVPMLAGSSLALAQDDAPAPPPEERPKLPEPEEGEKLVQPTPAPDDPVFTLKKGVTSPKGMSLQSRSFAHKGELALRHTCDGDGESPELTWSQVPKKGKSLVVVISDADNAGKVHWLVYNIPPDSVGLAPGLTGDRLPGQGRLGKTQSGETAYVPPCPDKGAGAHRLQHRVIVLNGELELGTKEGQEPPNLPELTKAMKGMIVDEATIMATVTREERPEGVGEIIEDAPPPPKEGEEAKGEGEDKDKGEGVGGGGE